MEEEGAVRLTTKQRRFIEEYCLDFNATRAAIRAGYAERSAQQIGAENLTKPVISAAIYERLNELSMSSEEAIKRLSDMGRASFEKFLIISETGQIELNLSSPEARAHLHLIKKIKQTKRSSLTDTGVVETTIYHEVELHDAKDAIKIILEAHKKIGGTADVDVEITIEA